MRSDVFSLGVILRRMLVDADLSDRTAGLGDALATLDAERQRTIAQERRETITSLRHRLEGDLEAIVAHCLAADPRARYASTLDLAQDIDRHLAGEAVLARGDSLAYRGLVVARQNRRSIATAALIAVVASIGIGWAMHERTLALIARDEAEDSGRRLQQANDFVLDLLVEIASAPGVKPRTATEMLAEASRLAGLRLSSDQLQEARVRYAIGQLFTHLQQHERASQEFTRVAAITGDRSNLPDFQSLHIDHSAALRALGRPKDAAREASAARAASQTQVPEDFDDQAHALVESARVALADGDVPLARAHAAEARRMLDQSPAERPALADEIDKLIVEIERQAGPPRARP